MRAFPPQPQSTRRDRSCGFFLAFDFLLGLQPVVQCGSVLSTPLQINLVRSPPNPLFQDWLFGLCKMLLQSRGISFPLWHDAGCCCHRVNLYLQAIASGTAVKGLFQVRMYDRVQISRGDLQPLAGSANEITKLALLSRGFTVQRACSQLADSSSEPLYCRFC